MQLIPVLALAGILFFAGVSFFFALAETALLSLGKWRTQRLSERDPVRGTLVAELLKTPHDLLATMVLGNTFAMAAVVAISLCMVLSGYWPTWTTLAVVFASVLIICEIAPKTLAVRRPESWSVRVAKPVGRFMGITRPLRRVAQKLNQFILSRLHQEIVQRPAGITDEEYEELLELAQQQGTLEEAEKEIILEIIRLDRRTVKEVMTARSLMASVDDDLPQPELVVEARKLKHHRLPIHDESPDTIVGIVDTRKLLLNPKLDLEEVIEPPSFVPETMNLLQLMTSLQRQQRGMAIILDEYGAVDGLVTMEDIIEELVGDIHSEGEIEEFEMERLGPGRWRVVGGMRIDDFVDEYPMLGEVPEVETMGGLMMSRAEVVPKPGQSVTYRGLRLTALATDERRVREILVERTRNR